MSPVLIVLGLLVKLDSPGPVLYRGERLGRLGKPFHILKFRTMVESPQKTAPITVEGDGRIRGSAGSFEGPSWTSCRNFSMS